jgi:hypothetical protein
MLARYGPVARPRMLSSEAARVVRAMGPRRTSLALRMVRVATRVLHDSDEPARLNSKPNADAAMTRALILALECFEYMFDGPSAYRRRVLWNGY